MKRSRLEQVLCQVHPFMFFGVVFTRLFFDNGCRLVLAWLELINKKDVVKHVIVMGLKFPKGVEGRSGTAIIGRW